MKQFYKYIFTLTTLLCITTYAWAGKVKLVVNSSPSNGGYVYANKKNENNIGTLTSDYAESDYKVGGSVNMYRFAKAADGYEFKGWADNDGGTPNSLASEISLGAAVGASTKTYTYYAIFAPITYTIAFKGNGSTSGAMDNISMVYNATKNLTANAFARQYTVTYNADGGTCGVGSEVAIYTFVGWEDRNSMVYNGKEYTGAEFDAPYYANTYGDLYNAFGYNKYNLLQHYVNNGKGENRSPIGSVRGVYPNEASVSNLSTTAKATVTLYAQWQSASVVLPNATKAGAVIDGWYAGGVKVGEPGDSYTPTADVTLTAKWIEKYTPEITGNNYTLFVDGEQANAFNFKYTNNPTAHIEMVSISEVNDGSGKVISYDAANNKIIAHNAGEATIYFTQAETETIKAGNSTRYTITVTKIDNTLSIASNSYTKYVDDVITNIITSGNSDATVTAKSSDATIAYYDVTSNTIIIPNSEAKSFSSQTITITIAQAETYKYTAIEKPINLTVNKYNISAFIIQNSAYLNALINNAFSLSYGLDGYCVTSLNLGIAEYVAGNKIQTYFTEGTAHFRVTRDEDYKYVGLNELFDLEVKKSEESCILFNTTHDEEYKVGYYDNEDGFEFNLGGEGASINLELKKQDGGGGHIYIIGYTSSGTEVSLGDVKGSDLSTSWSKHTFDFPTDKDIVKIKIEAGNDIWNDALNKYFKNVQVTRKTYLRPTVNPLALPQATLGRPVSASFDLSWSTCSDEVVLVSTNSNFVLSKSSIDATSGRGTTTITVTYDANSGSQSGTIIIYDQSQKIEIPVSCEVKSKLATEIIYTGEQQYGEIADGILYPFYVKDENGNTVQRAEITLATSNEDILSVDSTKIYPHCGGYVTLTATYAGDETHEPASKEQQIFVLECYQHIVWDQDLRGFLTDDNGTINETVELTAYAATESGVKTGTPVVYSLDTEAEKIAKLIDNHNGTYSLNVFGKGEGTITASISEYTFDGEQYYPNDYTRIIRVHASGDPCEPYSLLDSLEYAISCTNTTKILSLVGLPENSMSIMAHAAVSSYVNDLTVDFSTEETGDNWIEQQKQNIHSGSENKKYTFTVPENAKRVRFRTGSTLNTYFHNIFIRQKTYLTPSVTEININSTVNQEYTSSFEVEYSNMPHVQYSITNNHNLGLSISPRNEDINTFCNENGTIRFTITGTSLIPHEALTETLTITTAAGEQIPILITINAKLLETYSFDKQDGNWSDPANWTVNGSTPSTLPTASNPVVIAKKVTIDNQAVAYSIDVQEGGYVNIPSTGGLTVHAGGYTPLNKNEEDLKITIDNDHAGYFRMSPLAKTDMPKAQVNFTTRGQLNGGNKDAAWQYIGAPGGGVGMDLAHTTVLYLRSEEKGWVRQYTEWAQLTPFAGYALTQKEQETFTLYPQLLNETITIPLTYTENGMTGDNLWANSYAAPLDITKFTPEDFSGELDQTFYLYNSGSWNQWNNNQSSTDNASDFTPGRYYAINQAKIDQTKDQTVIPPMQGVYMKAKPGGGSITLNYEKHVWNNTQTTKMNTPLRVAGKEGEAHTQSLDFQRVRLQVNSENSGADRMYIIQDSVATAGYDNGYDAPKLMADGLVNIYTNEPFGKMEISSTDHMDGMYIGFQAGEDTHYIMTFTSLVGDSLYLYDLEEDKFVEMLDGEQYHFSAIAQSTNDMRFQVLVAPTLPDETPGQGGGVTTDVENITTPQLWISDRKVFVSNAKPNSTMAIYTASGMLITAPYTLLTTPYTLDLSYLPTGVYVLRLNDQAYKFVCK